jgi:hypothetical protein
MGAGATGPGRFDLNKERVKEVKGQERDKE